MGGGGGRGGKGGRSRTQRRHFRQNRENVWKRPKSDPSSENTSNGNGGKHAWEPFATQNPAFSEYYKVDNLPLLPLFTVSLHSLIVYMCIHSHGFAWFTQLGFGHVVL